MPNRAKLVGDSEGRFYGIRFDCPGCALGHDWRGAGAHVLPVDWVPKGRERSPHAANKPQWGFNGNLERPTFSPSILSRQTGAVENGVRNPDFVCHSFIRDGRIEFLSDCTHALAGQTVDLPEIDDGP